MSTPIRNADPSHIVAGQRTFFVTSSIFGKRSLLQSGRSARLFIEVLYHYRKQQNYLLHEFVVMPDHFHVLITLGADISVEKAVQLIKGGFAFRGGREFGFRAPVWHKGFSEVRVTTAESYSHLRDYIRVNPVKRGLAATCEDCPYSSACPGFELDPPPQRLKPTCEVAVGGIAQAMP